MNSMFPPENRRGEKNLPKASSSTIEHVTHDIVNQLSIICLCCCELRHSLAEKLLAHQLDELGKIEVAVQEAAKMIQTLKTNLQDDERASKKLAVLTRVEPPDSLYPIVYHPELRR
jgi:hypothetical protein